MYVCDVCVCMRAHVLTHKKTPDQSWHVQLKNPQWTEMVHSLGKSAISLPLEELPNFKWDFWPLHLSSQASTPRSHTLMHACIDYQENSIHKCTTFPKCTKFPTLRSTEINAIIVCILDGVKHRIPTRFFLHPSKTNLLVLPRQYRKTGERKTNYYNLTKKKKIPPVQ